MVIRFFVLIAPHNTFDPVTRLITILDSFQRKVLQFKLSGEFVREKVLDIRANDIAFVKPWPIKIKNTFF